MNLRIRTACTADVPAMHHVRLSVRENRLSDGSRITEASYLPYVRDGHAWVAEVAGELLGFAALDLANRDVWALFVKPGAEGMGAGSALHSRMIEAAQEAGIRTLTLRTSAGTRAEKFYRTSGWRHAGLPTDGEQRFELLLPG